MQTTAQRTTPNATQARERFSEQANVVADDLRELKDSAGDVARSTAGEVRYDAERLLEEKREQLRYVEDDLADKVRAQPLKSMAIAAGVGALFGRVFLRRS